MPFVPTDEQLVDAMADAVEKGKVLFLVDGKDGIGAVARRTRRLAEQKVAERLGAAAAQRLFTFSGNDWLLNTCTGGWLFFYPADLLNADDEVGDPEWVYWPTTKGEYVRVQFSEWRRLRQAGHVWRPSYVKNADKKTPKKTGPKTAWDRLLDDDLGE